MKKNIKKIFLFVAVVVTALVCFAFSASALSSSGKCGDNVYWEYNITTDELVISGTGPLRDYGWSGSPFYGSYIESVVINNGVTSIGDYAFYDCSSLKEITIPDSVTTIGDYAFSSCDSLTEVTIPDSVTTIGDRAFYNCDSLTEVTIPDSVTTIGSGAFSGCVSLTEVTIPDSVTTIGDGAFSGCDSLTEVTIPDSVTSIGDDAFYFCESLTEVTIPDSVTTIGDSAFFSCDSLTSVTIPDSVTIIVGNAFDDCYSLTGITVDENNQNYSSDEYGVLFNKDKTTLIKYPLGNRRTAYTIPDGVTTIDDYAFAVNYLHGDDKSRLTSITIPDSVTTIGDYAFHLCDSLAEVTIGDGVTTIGDEAFSHCYSLTEVTIPDSVITIGEGAFFDCYSLTEVTVPDSVTTIGGGAFAWCDSLTEVTIGNSVTTIGYYAFKYCDSLTEVTIPDSVTTIGEGAFSYCESLKEVTIGDSVTTIGDDAFYSCPSLTSVTIPDSVTTIGEGAFCGCDSLTSVTIGNGVTTIGDSAFQGCDSLTSITVNENNQNYSSDECGVLFNKDKTTLIQYPTGNKRTAYTIPDSVTTIGDKAFRYCSSLTNVTIPDSVTTIGVYAFCGCDSLKEVTIPDSVTTIGYRAFYSCDSLTDVYYVGTQEQWKKISIGSGNGRLTGAKIYFVKSPIQSIYPDEFTTGIDKYPDFKKLMSSYCALPGLKSTVVTDADQNVCYTCNCMTPQGICITDEYVLISAYCSVDTYKDDLTEKILNGDNTDKLLKEKNHSTHNSVIYVIDKNKHSLLTTLTLSDKNHVGGLAFDGSNIWIAKSSDKKVSSISLSTIKSAVNSGDEGVAVNYEKTFSCGHTASFVEYFDNKLWVGVFNEEESSYMYGFTFNGGKENVSGLTEVASVAIPAKANGAAFYSNGTKTALIVNSSYGRKNDSKIYLYDVKSALNQKNITINLMTTYIFPTLAEEVVVEGDKLYMIFESAATTYCNVDGNKASAVVDRICEGNAADFFSWTKDSEKVASTTYKGVTATIDSAYFENDSINYNHNLGRFCSLFTVIGYEYDRPDIIKQHLENCGFTVNPAYIVTDAGRDGVNHFISHKRIYANGKWQNLVFAAFIGSHEQQWYSNFDPETGSTHIGFIDAQNYVLPKIRKYIVDNGFEKDNTKILLTGHSRGAATCNLVAAQLISSEEFATKESIYAYAFATPNITKAPNAKQEKYNRIFNIVNPEDFVTKMLPEEWGFGKFGNNNIFVLPSITNTAESTYKKQLADMQVYYEKLVSAAYTPYPAGEHTVYNLIRNFTAEIKGLDDYYNKRINTSLINSITPYSFFQWVLCPFVAHDYEKVGVSLTYIIDILGNSKPDCIYRDVIDFFLTNEAQYMICDGIKINENELGKTIRPNFSASHRSETYCAYMYSSSSDQLTKTRLSRPMKIDSSQITTEVLLNWSAVEDADYYKVYRKHAGGWETCGSTTKTSGLIKNLKSGTKYTFAVKAGKIVDGKVIWSDTYTTINTATKTVAPSKITSAQNTTAIRLTWSKCPGATGYRIFYKSGNTWKICLNATANTTHTFTNLKAGTKFTFAVRPYIITDSGVVWSDYTTYTASTLPAIPKTTVTSPSSGKITVKWNAVSGAEAYQLYYKTGNGAYKLYKNYFSAQTVSFSGLKSGTKYTFAVRAAKNTSSGWVFGSFTPVSVTVK